jgi:hypothetical protein
MQDKDFEKMNQQIERAGCGCMIIVVISLILIVYAIF